jgi:hypothetical protein
LKIESLISIFFFKETKKELAKQKSSEKFANWLKQLKEREHNEAQRQREEQERIRLNREKIKKKREEQSKKLIELNKKKSVPIRPLTARTGVAIINGKTHDYYDWSTSPAPSFINKIPWQS